MLDRYNGPTRIFASEKESGVPEFISAVSALKSHEGEDAAFYAKQLVDVQAFSEVRACGNELDQ